MIILNSSLRFSRRGYTKDDRLTRSPQDAYQKLHWTGSSEHVICTLKTQGRRKYRSSSHTADKNNFFLDLTVLG